MANAYSLLDMARSKFSYLTPAEVKLFINVPAGREVDCRTDDEELTNPANADSWGKDRVIYADKIEWLCLDPAAKLFVRHYGINIRGARIKNNLNLSFANLVYPIGLFYCVCGAIDVLYACLTSLNLSGSRIESLDASCSMSSGAMHLCDGFISHGEVRLIDATIGGKLDCCNGRFSPENGRAINANGVKASDALLCNGFEAVGEVNLVGGIISGLLDCEDGKFINPQGDAIAADSIKVAGSIYMRKGFKAEGKIDLRVSIIENSFEWTNVSEPEMTKLDLRGAKVKIFHDDSESWPKPDNLLIQGLDYERLDDNAPKDAKDRIDWLRRQPQDEFRPQPYEQLAKVLRESGREEDAKKILIEKNWNQIRSGKMPFFARLWRRITGWTIGFGYRPMRALWIALFIIALGVGCFTWGNQTGKMTPVKKGEITYADGQGNVALSKDYPRFYSIIYSIDLFVPLVDLQQVSYWMPSGSVLLSCYMWLHIVAGWILSTLLVVSLTGLLRT